MSTLEDKVRTARFLDRADLAGIRHAAGVTQLDVGTELGVSAVAVSCWESRRRRPRGQLAERYVELLAMLARESTEGPS